jgi:hypothetical protein
MIEVGSDGVASIHYTELGAEDQPLLDTAVKPGDTGRLGKSIRADRAVRILCATSGPQT